MGVCVGSGGLRGTVLVPGPPTRWRGAFQCPMYCRIRGDNMWYRTTICLPLARHVCLPRGSCMYSADQPHGFQGQVVFFFLVRWVLMNPRCENTKWAGAACYRYNISAELN